MTPTDREGLEQWLRQCHKRRNKLGVAGMLLLFEPSSNEVPEDSSERVNTVFNRMTGGRTNTD